LEEELWEEEFEIVITAEAVAAVIIKSAVVLRRNPRSAIELPP